MKILEVRDGFIKFEAEVYTQLSSFIKVDAVEKSYIAQVFKLKKSGEKPIAYAKFLFLYDMDMGLTNYDKTLPSIDSSISAFDYKILLDSIKYDNPVIVGKTIDSDLNIVVDEKVFDKKLFISTDDDIANNIFVKNFAKQFENIDKKFVVIDTLGIVKAKKYVAGVDFKIPLDKNSLNFMYSDCLSDATSDSKALIVDIFRDLVEYAKTVSFLPFETLKNIVDDMVDKDHVFKLLVLKNKLAKFYKLGYFANNVSEVQYFENLLNSKCVIIDLSKLDLNFQNRYIEFIYEKLALLENVQVFFEMSNNVSKKSLKDVLFNEKVATTFISHSKFKYLNDIKNLFDNFIITPSFSNNQIFELYGTFLTSMQKNMYLVVGEGTNYIPIVSALKNIDEVVPIVKSEVYEQESEILSQVSENDSAEDVSLTEVGDNESQTEVVEETADELADNDIVEPEVVEEFNDSEDLEQNTLSEEEILSSIEEKSNEVLSQIAHEAVESESVKIFVDDSIEESFENVDNEEIDNFQEEALEQLTVSDKEGINAEEDVENNDFNTVVHETEDLKGLGSETLDGEFVQEDSELGEYLDISDDNILEQSSDEKLSQQNNDITEEDLVDSDSKISEDLEEGLLLENEDELLRQDEDLGGSVSNVDVVEFDGDLDVDINDNLLEVKDAEDVNEEEKLEEVSQDFIPLTEQVEDYGEITELDPDNIDENDIIVDLSDEEPPLSENIDEQIVRDVDKVFTTRKDNDEISDTDLDFIDELNSDDNEILEEVSGDDTLLEEIGQNDEDDNGILEDIQEYKEEKIDELPEEEEVLETKNASTPMVPIYSADIPQEDMVDSDPIQQGDSVTHAKYGSGVVEKMIKYGNKTLYSINFDNIGRRLLDPTLTEIKKS